MEGTLLKRGANPTDDFKTRWVTLSGEKLSYAPGIGARALGEIPTAELVGLAVSDASAGAAEKGKDKHLMWRKSCAGLHGDYHRARDHIVGQVRARPRFWLSGRASSSILATSFRSVAVLQHRRNRLHVIGATYWCAVRVCPLYVNDRMLPRPCVRVQG